MPLEYKTLALDRKAALEALGDGSGQLIGYASVWDGIDAYGDTIQRGAYTKTIPQFIERGTLHAEHDTRIRLGTIADAVEDDHGLLIRADFHSDLEAQRWRQQILERLSRGKFVGLSIGYLADEVDYRPPQPDEDLPPWADAVRILKEITLYEVSEVTVPADQSAEVIAAKTATNAVITDVKHAPMPGRTAEPDPEPAPSPAISFDLDDVRRCLAALGVYEEIAS